MAMMTADAKLEDTGAWFRNFLQPSKAKVKDAVFTGNIFGTLHSCFGLKSLIVLGAFQSSYIRKQPG